MVYIFVASLIAGWLLTGVVRRAAARRGLLDMPNTRSSHVIPTPRGGGIAIVIITLAAACAQVLLEGGRIPVAVAWIAGGGLVAGIGFLDDLKGVSAMVRAGVQALAAIVLLSAVDLPVVLGLPQSSLGTVAFLWVAGALAVMWSINLFNFMDGIDGLASAQCVFVVVAATLLTGVGNGLGSSLVPCIAMAGACVGFLIWNAPPAKIFMGDVGSGFIGFGLIAGALTTGGKGPVSFWTWLVLNGLFSSDATVTLLVRLMRGQRIYEAHRLHVYQRLARRWSSHGRVTAAYMSINLIWCLPWAIATTQFPGNAPVLALAALLPLCMVAVAARAGQTDP